jgi:ADP-heptose:LPS heptosyltransferase
MLGFVASLRGRAREACDARAARRVLLVEIALFGDVVSFTASLPPACAAFPTARIDVLVARAFAPLVAHDPRVSATITMHDFSIGAYLRVLCDVRRRRYDLILAMSPGLRNAGIALLGRGRAAAGYLVDRNLAPHYLKPQRVESCGIQLTKSVRVDTTTHIADRGLAVLRALGAPVPEQGCPSVVASEDARERVSTFLGGDGSSVRRFAALHPSASEARKRWPVERFIEVARSLLERHDLGIVWLGSRADAPLVARARDLLGAPSASFLGRPVDEVAALLERAALFVGNDSGPMHLAGAFGTSLVGIFGSGDPGVLLPRKRNAAAVQSRGPGRCVTAIGVQEVLDAAERVFSKG